MAGERPKPTAAGCLQPEESAFDRWLRESLQETFASVLAEPLPEDILRLIEEDRAERERLRSWRRKRWEE